MVYGSLGRTDQSVRIRCSGFSEIKCDQAGDLLAIGPYGHPFDNLKHLGKGPYFDAADRIITFSGTVGR